MLRLWSAVAHPPARRGKPEAWKTTYPTGAGDGSDMLEIIHLPPGGAVVGKRSDHTELITYIHAGTVAQEDASGRPYITRAGEFSRMAGGRACWTNAARSEWAHLFRLRLVSPTASADPRRTRKRFSLAERRDRLCLVASHDGRKGSLAIQREALVFSAIVISGQHVVHELPRGSCAWLHVVDGEVALGDIVLITGDGVGVAAKRALSFTAREDSEVLLLHVNAPALPSFLAEARP